MEKCFLENEGKCALGLPLPLATLEKWCFRAAAMGGEKKKRKKSCNVFGEGRRRSFFSNFLFFSPSERASVAA